MGRAFAAVVVAGILPFLLGVIPFGLADANAPPSGGAGFAALAWIVFGLPICFVAMPVAYFATRGIGVTRLLVFPALATVVAASVVGGNGGFEDLGDPSIAALLMSGVPLIWISWYAYLKIADAITRFEPPRPDRQESREDGPA